MTGYSLASKAAALAIRGTEKIEKLPVLTYAEGE